MNQSNSTIELSGCFLPEIRHERVAGKSFKKIRYRQNWFLVRYILMVKKNTSLKPKPYINKTFDQKNEKVFTLSDNYDQ